MRMRLICVLLCLVTWRGPLPWVHEHDADELSATADHGLAKHLAVFHADADDQEGWHWHILLPFGRCPCQEERQERSPTHDPLSDYGALVIARTPTAAAAHWTALACDEAAAIYGRLDLPYEAKGGHDPPQRPASFLSSLLTTAPLRAVTGVALC
jgi:hypothetical protein